MLNYKNIIFLILIISNCQAQNAKGYYKNGRLKWEGMIKNGKKDSLYKEYHYNGELSGQGHYKNGKRNGLWRWYHKNGKLHGELHYNNGKQYGLWKRIL